MQHPRLAAAVRPMRTATSSIRRKLGDAAENPAFITELASATGCRGRRGKERTHRERRACPLRSWQALARRVGGEAPNYTASLNRSVKVIDFVKSGLAKVDVDRTAFELVFARTSPLSLPP